MHGEECNTDNQTLRVKLLVRHRKMIGRKGKAGKNAKRFDVKKVAGQK